MVNEGCDVVNLAIDYGPAVELGVMLGDIFQGVVGTVFILVTQVLLIKLGEKLALLTVLGLLKGS